MFFDTTLEARGSSGSHGGGSHSSFSSRTSHSSSKSSFSSRSASYKSNFKSKFGAKASSTMRGGMFRKTSKSNSKVKTSPMTKNVTYNSSGYRSHGNHYHSYSSEDDWTTVLVWHSILNNNNYQEVRNNAQNDRANTNCEEDGDGEEQCNDVKNSATWMYDKDTKKYKYFDYYGKMKIGWFKVKQKVGYDSWLWYYSDKDGNMLKNQEIKENGKTYKLASDGHMYQNEWIGNVHYNEHGVINTNEEKKSIENLIEVMKRTLWILFLILIYFLIAFSIMIFSLNLISSFMKKE